MARFLTPEQKAESYKRAKEAKLCRWCGLDVHRLSAKRRTFCSDECVHEFNIRSSASYIRIYIAKRDKYICQICGLDCKGFVSRLRRYVREHIQELQQQPIYAGYQNYRHAQRALEMEFFDLRNMEWVNTHGRSTFYDIDHIIPFTIWKNNDLWNLLPARPDLNNQKRDKIPSPALIENRRELITHYWDVIHKHTQLRFQKELQVALLGYDSADNWHGPAIAQLKNNCGHLINIRGFEAWNG